MLTLRAFAACAVLMLIACDDASTAPDPPIGRWTPASVRNCSQAAEIIEITSDAVLMSKGPARVRMFDILGLRSIDGPGLEMRLRTTTDRDIGRAAGAPRAIRFKVVSRDHITATHFASNGANFHPLAADDFVAVNYDLVRCRT
jgi:hypothetical protein